MPGPALHRLRAVVVKELLAVLRDPKARAALFVPPLLQLFVFGFAMTLEVRGFAVGVLDRDGGAASTELVSRVAGSPQVGKVVALRSPAELRDAIDNQRIIAGIVIDDAFSADLAARRSAQVQVVLDGRRSNAAQIVANYVQQIIAGLADEGTTRAKGPPASRTVVTNWFNPALEYRWFVMPALIVTIGALMALAVTAQSVARERELGSFDQLMVSPLRVHEILVGKMTPPLIVGLANGTFFVVLIPLVFGVPFKGSLLSLYASLIVFLLSLIGVGMLISSLARTQQQAFLGSFLLAVPAILLSGFATPVDNMPGWLQTATLANPLRHFLVVTEGVFLKDMPVGQVLSNTWPVAIISALTLSASAILFRARME